MSTRALFALATVATTLALPADLQAAPNLEPPLAEGLAGPLQLAVDGKTVYIAQGFSSTLAIIGPKGRTDVQLPGLTGVDARNGRVLFTTREGEPGVAPASATLRELNADGTSTMLADVLAYEQSANPDQVNTYGFEGIAADCAAQLPAEIGPPEYTGQVDSNPFAVAIADHGAYIADAGANAILHVTQDGAVHTVAVLPPQPAVIDAAAAQALGLPACVVGLTYRFEPVPTDVEVGRNGFLYVTTLPGGPEDPSLGARGSVYRINPHTGRIKRVMTGLLGATNLSIGPQGRIFVSELFGGRVTRVDRHRITPLIELASPAGLEFANGRLYVGYDAFANGTVATIRP